MLILAGLGNVGRSYEHNRHNVGFMAADAIARRHSFAPWSSKFHADIATGTIGDERVLLMKPRTMMNLSGQAVGEAMRFHKLEPKDVTVLYDELDLLPGKVRIKTGGGSGGHNGIRSLDAHIGNPYRRVRIGIGHPGVKELVHSYVLGDFAKADGLWLEPLLDALADNAELLVKGDDSSFMNRLSLAVPGHEAEPEKSAQNPKGRSHIRQARPPAPSAPLPQTGPMAAMLKKLLGKDG